MEDKAKWFYIVPSQALLWRMTVTLLVRISIYFVQTPYRMKVLVVVSKPQKNESVSCNLLRSSVHGISQVRILEWVAIPFSRGSSWHRDQTQVSCIGRQFLYCLSHPGGPLNASCKSQLKACCLCGYQVVWSNHSFWYTQLTAVTSLPSFLCPASDSEFRYLNTCFHWRLINATLSAMTQNFLF